MSSNSDKFETLISFVSHIDDSNLSAEIDSLQRKIERMQNKIAVKGSTKELEDGLRNLENQVDSLYSRFEKFIPRIQEAQTLGIKFSNISLNSLVTRFRDLGRSIEDAKSKLQDTYSRLQEFAGDKGQISLPDFTISRKANIEAWVQQLRDLGAADIVFDEYNIKSAKFEEALTGLGIRITTLSQTGTEEFQKLSAAGEVLAETFRNMGDAAFQAFDEMDDPKKLKALSDKIQNIRMTAWSDTQDAKINREFAKMSLADGISKEVQAADAALDEFMRTLRDKGNISIETAKDVAKELGGSLNLSNIVTNEAGEFHASAQLITKDLQTISFSLKSYKMETQKGDVWGVTTGGVSQLGNIISQTLGEYQAGLNKTLQLRRQLSQAEESGNKYAADILKQQITINEQHNAELAKTITNVQWTTEALEGMLAVETQIGDTINLEEANRQWEQEKIAIDGVIQKYNELKQAELKVEQASLANAPKGERQIAWAEKTRALNEYQTAYSGLSDDLKNNKVLVDGLADADAKAAAATQKLTSAANSQGFSLKALATQFKTLASNVLQYQLAWKGFQMITDAIKKVIATTKELDSAMMNIRLVTGQTQEQVQELMNSYAELGKTVGATATQVAEGAIGWLRQGRSLEDTTKLIETSTKLSKLGMMDASEATQLLTATLNGFNVAVADSESIVDKLVKVDMNFATSTQELATALQYTAASANLAGVNLDQMIGLIATVSATTRRSAESIGQSFKTMFSRLQRVSAGKNLDEYGESLNDVEKRLSSLGIALRDSQHEWRNEWDVMNEIGEKWQDFTSIEKSAIAEVMGGTRQRENLLVVFENWDKVLKATSVSMSSAGTAEQKYAAYMDSLEAKTAQFTATWQKLVNNLSAGDTLKGFVDFGTHILEIIDKFHLLQVAMVTALGAGGFKLFETGIIALDKAITPLRTAIEEVGKYSKELFVDIGNVGMSMKALNDDAIQGIVNGVSKLNPVIQAQVLNMANLDDQAKETIASLLGLELTEEGQFKAGAQAATGTELFSGALKRLVANLKLAISQMVTFLTTNPAGWAILAIGAFAAAIAIFDKLTTTFEEQQEKISSLKQEYESLESELQSIQGEIKTTTDRINELVKASKEGKITLVEAEELSRLKRTNAELKIQLETKKQLAKIKADELSSAVEKAYNPSSASQFANRGGLLSVFKQIGYAAKTRGLVRSGDPLEDFQNELNQLSKYKRELADLQKQLDSTTDPDTIKDLTKQIETTSKVVDTLTNSTSSFVDIMQENMASLDETIPEQAALKAEMQGLIDAYIKIMSPESYFAIKLSELSTKLDENGKKTKEYEDALNDLANEILKDKELWDMIKGSLGLTDEEIESLETGTAGMKEYDAAFQKFADHLDSEELKAELEIDTSDIDEAEEKVSALASAIDDFTDKAGDLKDALDELNAGGGLSLETVSKLAQKFPELEDALYLYLAGVKSDVELQRLLQSEYDKTTQEYKNSLIAKLEASTEFYNAQIKGNDELRAELSRLYGVDVNNFSTAEALKAELARVAEQQIVSAFQPLPPSLSPTWDAMASGFASRCSMMTAWAAATANAIIGAFSAIAAAQAAIVGGGAVGSTKGGLSGANNLGVSGIQQKDVNLAINQAQAKVNDLLGNAAGAGLGAGKIGTTGGGGSPSGSGSSGSGEDTRKAEFEAAKAELDHLRKMDLISTKEYYDALGKLVDEYYKDNEEYISEYKSEEEGLYDLKKELFEQDRENLEIDLEILENQVGTADQRLAIYEKIMESVHLQAEELRKMGVSDDTDTIRELQKIYRDNNQKRLDTLEDIIDEQKEGTEHIKNLLEISGNLTVEKELELATQNYQFIIQMYDKYKDIYEKDERAYRQYIEAKKDATDDLRDAVMASIDKMFDTLDDKVKEAEATLRYAGLNVLGDTQKIAAAVDKAFQMGLITLQEYQKYRLDLIERERDAIDTAYEKIKNASIKAIEAQIKALQDQKDADDEYYDNKIKSIQAIISAMDKEKDAEDKLLALEKKRYALENAKRQKTVQIYREGVGFVWEADPEEVRKATEDYNDAIRDYNNWQKKLDLQGQIDDFEKAKEANAKIVDEEIDKLNELKEAWEKSMDLDDIFDEYEESIRNLMDDESLSFDQRMAKVNEFTDAYKKKISEIGQANTALGQQILALAGLNLSGTQGTTKAVKTWYATKEGLAPAGASVGDKILTGGGTYQIVEAGTVGATQNPITKLWSVKLDDVKTVITDELAGTVKSIDTISTNTQALLDNTNGVLDLTNILSIFNGNIEDMNTATANTELPDIVGGYQTPSSATIPELTGNIEDYFGESVRETVGKVLRGGSDNGYSAGTKVTEYAGIINKATGEEIKFTSTSNNVYEALKEQGISRDSVSLANQTAVSYTVGGRGVSEGVQKDRAFNTSKKGTSRSGSHEEFYGTDPDAYKRAKRGFATGTQNSPATYSLVDELGEELIIRPPSQGRPTYLEKGTGVIPADITKNLWKMGQNPELFFKNEFDKQVERYSGFSWDTSGGTMSIVIGDINLSGVQDVDGLSRAIVTKLPNQIIRDLYK